MQRSTNYGEPSSNGYIYVIVPVFIAQEIPQTRGQTECKSHNNTRISAVKQSLLEMIALNKMEKCQYQ